VAWVYGFLTLLLGGGRWVRNNFEGAQGFFDWPVGAPHDHMVNVETGEVVEFVSPEIEKLQKAIAEEHGVDLVDHNLVLYVRKKK
jgi:Fur family ferric uptake transcriptional regulator